MPPTASTSRAFLPAFLTAFTLRYGQHFPGLSEIEFLQSTGAEPMWFTNNLTILVLGVLAAIEVAATKIPEAQEALETVHKYAKTAIATVSTMGVLSAGDLQFIERTISQANVFDTALGLIVGAAVYVTSTVRGALFAVLIEADSEDDFGIRRLVSWAEDVWAGFGVFALFLYPIAMAVLLLAAIGALFGARKYVEYREDKKKVPCGACGALIYGSALKCPSCGADNPAPKQVGMLGGTTDKPVTDRSAHPYTLVFKKRCPVCATRLEERTPHQTCPGCGHELFADRAFADAYRERVNRRLPKVLAVSALFSLVPIFGLIPAVIYYRIQLLTPFRAYIPVGRSFLLKWLVRLIFFPLITVQVVPGLGAGLLPLMALISYTVYRSAFSAMLRSTTDAH